MKKAWLAGCFLLGLVLASGCHRLAEPASARSGQIALQSYHGRWVAAQDEREGWTLRQRPNLEGEGCTWFTRYDLGSDKIALKTCYGRFVTAPRRLTRRR